MGRTRGVPAAPMNHQEMARLRSRAERDPGLRRQLGLELLQSGSAAAGLGDPGAVALLEEAVGVLRMTSAQEEQPVDGLLVSALAALGLALMEHRGGHAAERPLAEVVDLAGADPSDRAHWEERLAVGQSLFLLARCRETAGDLPAARQLLTDARTVLATCGGRPGVAELCDAVEQVATRLQDDA